MAMSNVNHLVCCWMWHAVVPFIVGLMVAVYADNTGMVVLVIYGSLYPLMLTWGVESFQYNVLLFCSIYFH